MMKLLVVHPSLRVPGERTNRTALPTTEGPLARLGGRAASHRTGGRGPNLTTVKWGAGRINIADVYVDAVLQTVVA